MTDTPVPLRLPAILQNPVNTAQRQVDAYAAQQRDKAAAARERERKSHVVAQGGGETAWRGKRVMRRRENASHASNPYATAPSRRDLLPTVPLHSRPARPSFPPSILDTRAPVPSSSSSTAFYASSTSSSSASSAASASAGQFSTSLRGVRAMLRRRGRRAETVVGVVEGTVRGWLDGDWGQGGARVAAGANGEAVGSASRGTKGTSGAQWVVLDTTPVSVDLGPVPPTLSDTRSAPHSLAAGSLPALPLLSSSPPTLPAILELSRSPAHLTFAISEPFDRLVTHLVCRYYSLISWSAMSSTSAGEHVRLTHVVVPAITRPRVRPPGGAGGAGALVTPETTDVSESDSGGIGGGAGPSAATGTSWVAGSGVFTDSETDSDVTVEGYSLDSESEYGPEPTDLDGETTFTADSTFTLSDRLAGLELSRTVSHGSVATTSSSAFASESDDAGSEMGGSLFLDSASNPAAPVPDSGAVLTTTVIESWDAIPETTWERVEVNWAQPAVSIQRSKDGPKRFDEDVYSWKDRPTFFDYLFG